MKKKVRHILSTTITAIFCFLFSTNYSFSNNTEILRFEHYNTSKGLSQNTASSILSDSKGFLWIGTNNGLNRYDGNKFRVFMNEKDGKTNFTHNRIVNIWEDKGGFIWFETHDGHYHYFNPILEQFTTLSVLLSDIEEGHSIYSDFLQYTEDEIWLGLNSRGVLRLIYDKEKHSYNTTHYVSRGINAISNDNVNFVRKDQNNNIWIGSNKGITFIDNESITNNNHIFQHLFISHSFTSYLETISEIWFGTKDAGIIKFHKDTQTFSFINSANTPTLKSNNINQLHITKDSVIFSAFDYNGLGVLYPDSDQWMSIPLNGRQVNKIYEDRFDMLWISTENFGLSGFNISSHEVSNHQFLNPDQVVIPDEERHVFFEDSKNNFWVGTHEGALSLYDRRNNKFLNFRNDPNNPNSISSNIVLDIHEDQSGQIWVGTGQYHGGIEKIILKNQALNNLLPTPQPEHISDNIVRAVFEDSKERLWIGTKAGRLHIHKDGQLLHVFNNFSTPNGVVSGFNTYCITIDKRGYLWLGSKGKGILISRKPLNDHHHLPNLSFDQYLPLSNDSTSLGHINVYSMAEDNNGNMWIGTHGNGISVGIRKTDGSLTFRRITSENSQLSSNLVRNILSDSKGRIWIATGYGLNLIKSIPDFNQKDIPVYSFYSGPEAGTININDIIHLLEDKSGQIWLATFGGGVNKLEEDKASSFYFRQYNQIDGLSNNVVYGLLEDHMGHLWLSTENGLSKFNTNNQTFEVFNTNNGLSFDSFSENACFRRSNGELLFGGFKGIEIVKPEMIIHQEYDAKIELTDFQLFNKTVAIDEQSPLQQSISYTEKIILKSNQSSFSFEFSSMDYLDPDKTQYAYKLDNFDDDWNIAYQIPRAVYTNLSPGEYQFRVKASNRAGEWNSEEKAINIMILPPWYKTIWAFIGYSVILVLLFLIIFKTFSKLYRYRNELNIERRVNDMKLRFFTNISHEIRTPLTLIIGPIEDLINKPELNNKDKHKLEIIWRNGKRMLQLVNQILDFRKIQNNKMHLNIVQFNIVEFTRNIYKSFVPLAVHKNISYQFSTSQDDHIVWGDPTKLDMIIYNLLSNALKFTDVERMVKVEVYENIAANTIEISVIDEGRGIPREDLPHLFERFTILSGKELAGTGIGLSLSYELAKLHHGDIRVESNVGEGSKFTLILRKGNKHFKNDLKSEFISEPSEVVPVAVPNIAEKTVEKDNEATVADTIKPLILIVEDNQEIAEYISQSLNPDFTTILAQDGKEALNLIAKQNPTLIISDIMMPVMDGIEMTLKIKDNFETSHIPIILLTSKSDIEDQIAGLQQGADAYITKPFNSEYLKAVACNLIEQRKNIIEKYRDKKIIDPASLNISSKDEEFLQKLVNYVEENHSEDFTIEQLAEVLCVSRTVFYNKVKSLTGQSPVKFVRDLKLKIAAHLLTKGYNISEAAIKIGFSDARYFSRQFRELFGYLPSKHLKKNK